KPLKRDERESREFWAALGPGGTAFLRFHPKLTPLWLFPVSVPSRYLWYKGFQARSKPSFKRVEHLLRTANVFFMLGLLVILIKTGNLILRPHQKKWVQSVFEN